MPKLRGRRWIVVTGSPSPHNLVAPAATPIRNPNKDYRRPSRGESRDPEYLEEMRWDAFYAETDGDWAMAERGIPLADFECDAHGVCYCRECSPGIRPASALIEDLRQAREALSKLVSRPRRAKAGKSQEAA